MNYLLMHRDQPVLEMELDEMTGCVSAVGALFAPERVPVGVAWESGAADRAGLNHWWRDRSIPAARPGIRDAMEQLGVSSPRMLPPKCFGLSLSDQYWIRPENRQLRWSEINFF